MDPSRRHRREFGLLLTGVLVLAALLSWGRLSERQGVLARETERLAMQARAVEQSLVQQLQSIYAALKGLRDDLPDWRMDERSERAATRMAALRDVMPAVKDMHWLDASGRVLASTDPQARGRDEAAAPWLAALRQRPDPVVLFVSEPFDALDGTHTLKLSLAIAAPQGGLSGVVNVTLDPKFLDALLGSVAYAPDVAAFVVHGRGAVLLAHPGGPGSAGLAATRPDERLLVQRTLRPPGVPMDPALVLGIGRQVEAALAPWQRQTELIAAFYAAAVLAAAFALRTRQRRRSEQEARRQAEAAEAERLRLALAGGELALWDLDVPANHSTVNERWSTMLGYQVGEVKADDAGWQQLIHPDDRARVVAAQNAHMAGTTPAFEATYRMRHREGHWIWVLDRGRVLQRDAQGRALRMVGTHMDISERVAAEDTLRRSEESLAITLQSIGDAVIATDAQGSVTRINDTARRLTGWAGDSALGRPLAEVFRIFNAQTREPECDPMQRVLASDAVVGLANGTLLLARDGHEYQIADSAAPIRAADGRVVGVVLVFSDVTEQYRMVQALRLAGRLARLGGFRVDLRQEQVWLTAETADILDAEPGATHRVAEVMPGVAPQQRERLQQALHGGQAFDTEIEFTTARRRVLQLRVLAEPVTDAAGQVVAMQGALQDVTDWRREQQQLRLLEAAVARLNDVVLITEPEPLDAPGPAIVFANAAFERLTGWPVAEVLGRSVHMLMGPDSDATAVARFGAAVRRQEAVRAELLHYGRDGRTFWVDSEVVPLLDASGRTRHLVAVLRDISERVHGETERRALERRLREAQKIESIGTLAGGIAHDFNNILAAILGNVALARDDLPPGHAALASLEQINRAGLRARSLVQQILTFSRREQQALVTQPLQPVVEETLSLLRVTLPATVRLDATLAAQPLLVRADATQLQQVLMNLCTNAWHALPAGRGHIRVGLAPGAQGDANGAVTTDGPDSPPPTACAHLWVADDGSGMDAATRERVFDPFFTTKPVGQGTGLGLSVVHGIVRAHGGRIWVDSAPGQGSTFHVLLPLESPLPAAADAPVAVRAAPAGNRHVLYVDDDEVMALVVSRLLQRAGYQVNTCISPVQALDDVREAPWRYDIVVSDHNMPEMSGTELAARLLRVRPALPVVISTGYVSDALRRDAAQAGVRAVLQKEHTLERLAGVVQQVLAGALHGG